MKPEISIPARAPRGALAVCIAEQVSFLSIPVMIQLPIILLVVCASTSTPRERTYHF